MKNPRDHFERVRVCSIERAGRLADNDQGSFHGYGVRTGTLTLLTTAKS